MSDMIDSVARAICTSRISVEQWENGPDWFRMHWRSKARDAIAAMREPTFDPEAVSYHQGMSRADWWRAMIDKALAPAGVTEGGDPSGAP